jgi:hypothetical protein
MWHVWRRGDMHTGFWWGKLKEDRRVDEKIILKYVYVLMFTLLVSKREHRCSEWKGRMQCAVNFFKHAMFIWYQHHLF